MGYDTNFDGAFVLDKELDEETYDFLIMLNETRRMKRDMKKIFPDMSDEEILEKFGVEGEFYFDGLGFCGQDSDASVIDLNCPPSTQPGLWCQWIPSDDRKHIEWDGGEKAYEMFEWIEYIIDKILKPRGYVLNGTVIAHGEDDDDIWKIEIKDNQAKKLCGHIVYDEEE